MLVLTRKIGEQIVISDNIRVTVVSVGPGRVKIGIEAPASVSIDRQEVHDKKRVEAEPVGPPAPSAAAQDDNLAIHNRIAGIAPAPADQTPADRPTVTAIRERLIRKPR